MKKGLILVLAALLLAVSLPPLWRDLHKLAPLMARRR